MTQHTPLESLRAELRATDALEHLASDVPDETDARPTRIAFVGPYNAGKSSLIAALTKDLSLRRDAKPETVEVSYHDWNDLHLVDVPGWFSGFEAHDDTADDELRLHADLVAFCLTVELGDENTQAAVIRVFNDLGFAGRGVLVVNKSNTEDNEEGVILTEVRKRTKAVPDLPVILTDAQDYLDTIEGKLNLDDEAVAFLREDSHVPALEAALLDLADRNQDARAQAQAQQAGRVIDDAIALLIPDLEEVTGRELLTELRKIEQACRARLDTALENERGRLTKELAGLANDVIVSIQKGVSYEVSKADTSERWAQMYKEARERLDTTFEDEVDHLAADTSTTLSVLPLDELVSPQPSTSSSLKPGTPGVLRRMFKALDLRPNEILDPLTREAEKVAKGGAGQDSLAYELTRKLYPNRKYVSHGRLKEARKIVDRADKVTKTGKVLPRAWPVALEGANWWREYQADKAAKEREASIQAEFNSGADTAGGELTTEFLHWTKTSFAPVEEKLDVMQLLLNEPAEERNAKIRGLNTLREALSAPTESLRAGSTTD